MAITTIERRPPLELLRPLSRLVLAALVTIAVFVAAFVIGRVSAPTHTVRSVVTVPAVHTVSPNGLENCRAGQPC